MKRLLPVLLLLAATATPVPASAQTATATPTPTATPALVVDVGTGGAIVSYGSSSGNHPSSTVYPLDPTTANAVATAYAGPNGGVDLSGLTGPDSNGQYAGAVSTLPTPTPRPTVNTLAAGAAAGTGATASFVAGAGSNLQRGAIQWTTGTAPSAGAQVVVTFPAAFGAVPYVSCFARTAATAGLELYATSQSAGGVTIAAAAGPAAGTTYSCEYLVVP